MISYIPWYIIVGEFGIAQVFALLARILRRGLWRVAVVAGIAGGASIFVCYAAAFLLTDRFGIIYLTKLHSRVNFISHDEI